jgi:hypothetical protein
MFNMFADLFKGQGRATNTIKLRKAYNQYVIDASTRDETPVPFQDWARSMYPDMKILEQ